MKTTSRSTYIFLRHPHKFSTRSKMLFFPLAILWPVLCLSPFIFTFTLAFTLEQRYNELQVTLPPSIQTAQEAGRRRPQRQQQQRRSRLQRRRSQPPLQSRLQQSVKQPPHLPAKLPRKQPQPEAARSSQRQWLLLAVPGPRMSTIRRLRTSEAARWSANTRVQRSSFFFFFPRHSIFVYKLTLEDHNGCRPLGVGIYRCLLRNR